MAASDASETGFNRRDFILFLCVGLFMVSLVLAAITAVKIHEFNLFGFAILVPAGTLAFGLTYLATDVISEVWGRAYAYMVVLAGLAMRFLMLVLILYAVELEDVAPFVTNAAVWTAEQEASFEALFATSNRINIAGMVAFATSALTDIFIFHRLKVREAGRNLLWLRNNISTMTSQVFNTLIFITVAFGGTLPWSAIGSLILGQVIVKLLVAAFDTPLVYVLRNLAQGRRLLDLSG